MIDFLIGLVVGFGVLGSAVSRQIAIHDGKIWTAARTSAVNGVFYYLSIYFIAKSHIQAYIGTMVGSVIISIYIAYRRKNELEKQNGNSSAGNN